MPVAAAIVGSAVLGAGTSIVMGNKAAKAQKKAAASAQASQERMFNKQVELQEPFRQAGMTAQQQIMQLLGIGGDKTAADYGSLAKSFGTEQFQADPGYAFRQAEGQKALERSAAARGGLLSGSALKGIERFGQDLASQEYTNAFNRYQTERAARLNPLQSLMGSGQSAANTLTSAASNYGQQSAQNAYNAGAARASGYTNAANAINSATGTIANYYTQAPLYNAMTSYYSGGAGTGTGAAASDAASGGIGYGSNYFSPSPNGLLT